MSSQTDATIAKQGMVGVFAYVTNNLNSEVGYLGNFSQNIIESLSKSNGTAEPILAPNPYIPDQIDIVDYSVSAPELGEMPFRERLPKASQSYLNTVFKQKCPLTFLIKISSCGRKDDLTDFEQMIIVKALRVNDLSIEALMAYDGSVAIEQTGTIAIITYEHLFPLRFASQADLVINAEILDIIIADAISCGTCSRYSDGCDKKYALQRSNSGSPGLSAQLVYTLDGSTWLNTDIDTLGGQTANRLAAVGQYIVVVSEADGAHHYALKSDPTSWTRVTGYTGGAAPRAIYAKSASEVFIGGAGGYLYRLTSALATPTIISDGSITTQNINDIHGTGQTIIAVGNNDTVLISTNNGKSFGAGDSVEAGANLLAVWVKSAYQWEVGTSTGKRWITSDQGVTYTQVLLPNQDDIAAILDIGYSPEVSEVGAIAVQMTDGTGEVLRTFTGGREFYPDTSIALAGLPVNERINAVALCGVNTIAAGGKKSGSTDGLIAVAS